MFVSATKNVVSDCMGYRSYIPYVVIFCSSQTVITNGHIVLAPGSSGVVHAAHLTVGSLVNQSDEGSAVNSIKLGSSPPLPHSVNAVEKPSIDFGTVDTHGQLTSSSSNSSTAGTQAPSPGVYFSASDPVLVPSHDSRLPGAVVAIKREVGSQRTPAEQISLAPSEGKSIAGQDFANLSWIDISFSCDIANLNLFVILK